MTNSRMKVITFGSKKGGVGKTTLTFNLGSALAAAGSKVLIVDLDSQSATMRTFSANPGATNLATLLTTSPMDEMPTRDAITPSNQENLDVLNARHEDLELARLQVPQSLVGKSIRRALAPVAEDYDFVLIDTPPELTGLQPAAVIAADYVVAVSRASQLDIVPTLAFVEQHQMLRAAGETEAEFLGLVWNFFDARAEETRVQLANLAFEAKYRDLPVFDTTIPAYKELSKANAMETTAAVAFENNASGQRVLALAMELTGHVKAGTTPEAAGMKYADMLAAYVDEAVATEGSR